MENKDTNTQNSTDCCILEDYVLNEYDEIDEEKIYNLKNNIHQARINDGKPNVDKYCDERSKAAAERVLEIF